MLPTIQLAHVALTCADLPRMERFYREILGYSLVWRPDEHNCYLSLGYDSLALHQEPTSTAETRLDHFGFTLAHAQDVDAWAAHLKASGVFLENEVRTHRDGTRSFYLRDPEGNRIQFMHLGASMTFHQEPEHSHSDG